MLGRSAGKGAEEAPEPIGNGAEGAPVVVWSGAEPVGNGAGAGFACAESVWRGAGTVFTGAVVVLAPVLSGAVSGAGTFCVSSAPVTGGTCVSPAPVILSLFSALSFSSVSMTSFSRTVTPWSWAIRLAMACISIDVP